MNFKGLKGIKVGKKQSGISAESLLWSTSKQRVCSVSTALKPSPMSFLYPKQGMY